MAKRVKKDEAPAEQATGTTLVGNRPKITAASNIMKKSGFMKASDKSPTRYILTGKHQIDNARQLPYAKGIKCGGVTVVYGQPGAGKSTEVYEWIANWQKQGYVGALMDLENSWDPIWAAALGVKVDDLYLVPVTEFMDSALQKALDALKGKFFDFIVMDSLHAVATRREAERDDTIEKEKPVAALAGKLTQFLRVAKPHIDSSESALIIIGHARIDVNAGPMARGPQIQLTGGEHLQHECDLIFQVTKSMSKTRAPWVNDQALGHAMGMFVEKARGPGIYSRFDEIFITGKGFSEAWVIVPKILGDTSTSMALFKQSGHFYTWTNEAGEDLKIQGRPNLIAYFDENRTELGRLVKAYEETLSGPTEQREESSEGVPETSEE